MKKILFFLLALSAIPLAAAPGARACDCLTLGELLNRAAEKITSGIATPLDSVIREAAAYGASSVHADLVALREAVLLAKDSITASVEASDKNSAERDIERTYEASSQPETSCGLSEAGAGYQLGVMTTEKASEDILKKVMQRKDRHQRPLDYQDELRDPSWPGPDKVSGLLGASGQAATLSLEETGDAARLIESLTDPVPLPNLPEELKSTPAGKIHEAAKKDYLTKKALYQGLISQRAAERTAAIDGLSGWVRASWASMGGKGDPPYLKDGKLSEDAFFWYLANVRLASANWHEEVLPTLPEAGLLREIASMSAVSLELQRRQNKTLENLALILSLGALSELETTSREAVRAQYDRAASKAW